MPTGPQPSPLSQGYFIVNCSIKAGCPFWSGLHFPADPTYSFLSPGLLPEAMTVPPRLGWPILPSRGTLISGWVTEPRSANIWTIAWISRCCLVAGSVIRSGCPQGTHARCAALHSRPIDTSSCPLAPGDGRLAAPAPRVVDLGRTQSGTNFTARISSPGNTEPPDSEPRCSMRRGLSASGDLTPHQHPVV